MHKPYDWEQENSIPRKTAKNDSMKPMTPLIIVWIITLLVAYVLGFLLVAVVR